MAIAGLFLFLGGCQKEDDNIKEISTSQKKFLNSSISDYSGISSHVLSATEIRSDEIITNIKGIKSKLLELDRSNGLFTKIIHRYGYPIWDQILVSENSNLKFVYFFPILKPYKDLTNGFLKVSMKLNGQIIMHFVDENDVILAIQNDRFSDLTLQYASIKYKFDTDLFSKRNDGLQIFINYFIESNDQRLTPRNTCWDDVVITFYSDEYTSSSTGWHTLYDVNGTVNNTTFSPIRHVIPGGRKFTISTFNPDCFDSGQGDVIIYPPDLSGGTSISYSSYFAKVEKNLIFVNACMNNTQNIPVADDSHNNPAGESWLWSPEDVKKCNLIKQLSACGLSESYVSKYLSAYETGVFTEIVKNFSTNQFCGSPFLDDALYNYFLLVESQLSSVYLTSNVSFSSYINSYIAIQTFLNSHNNDQISTQVANHFSNFINSNFINLGSGNTLTLEYLNILYLHETLKSNYPDYNTANINIDQFINNYGAEKYLILVEAFKNYKNLNLNIGWEELVNGLDEYLSLSDPNNTDDGQGNINNGITISGITPLILPLSGVNIGGSPARGNTEDLMFGDGGDEGVLNGGFLDSHYFADMRGLFAAMTVGSTYNTGQEYIDQFQVIQSVDFNMVKMPLIQKVSNSGALKDYLKLFGDELKKKLKVIGGNNQQNIGIIDMDGTRPVFSSYGLQIFLNDTEQTEILLVGYDYNSASKQFDADVFIEITDHFGMDKADVLKFQYWNPGFAAWWRLQHVAGYKPFRTKLYLKAKITGIL